MQFLQVGHLYGYGSLSAPCSAPGPLPSINRLQLTQRACQDELQLDQVACQTSFFVRSGQDLCIFRCQSPYSSSQWKQPLNKMSGSTVEPSWKPAVDAVRKYYNFLVEELGAIPADCVEYPPEEGWSSISEASLAGLEKTKQVVDVLRHLPYIKYSSGSNVQIAFATEALDYRGAEVAVGDRNRWIPHGNLEFPPHVVVLTADDGPGSYGSQVLLDTEKSECSSSTLVPVLATIGDSR